MAAQLLFGDKISIRYRLQIYKAIRKRIKNGYRAPVLAVIMVGYNQASLIYVKNKINICKTLGIISMDYNLPENVTQIELTSLINNLNNNPIVDGILVQMPLPKQINSIDILNAIDPQKDVDGFSPYNIGRLAQGCPNLSPCTSAGVMLLLAETKEKLIGKKATIIGTSNIVGKPMFLELILAGCTITMCSKNTVDLKQEVKIADIIIVAVGYPKLIKGDWIKHNSIVIDIGINRTNDGLVGDVEFEIAKNRAAWITPVPRGVGPMTVTCLMRNTLLANINRQNK